MSKHQHTKLGQFLATAICGNDILSSALYVSGIAIVFAGVYAPLVLLAVAAVLFFYRTVYREVVEALPVNGGVYNALLNGTSKTVAAIAGVMTILSYVATAVISAKTAIEYLFKFIEELLIQSGNTELANQINALVIPGIILILLFFALLVINGVKDSAKVAAGIFLFHILTLTSFVIVCVIALSSGNITDLLQANIATTNSIIQGNGGSLPTLFLAFSASLLGVSGFESSANFVEEQAKGVFKKTLRNMLMGVAIFNPLIALVLIHIMPIVQIAGAKDFLLAEGALAVGGIAYLGWISINAFLVLSGAVLTSYIGISGLVNRMSLDNCLPSFLSKENRKGSHPRIVFTFFALCTSILVITGGDLLSLAGVYTISFLGVMSLFALGNLILRQTRPELKRSYKAPIGYVLIALIATLLGIVGNSLINPQNDFFFLFYFLPAFVLVICIIYKKDVLAGLSSITGWFRPMHKLVLKLYEGSKQKDFYIFVHHSNRLFSVLNYISHNECGCNLHVIHCKNGDKDQKKLIAEIIPMLKHAGIFPHMNIEFEYIDAEFNPETVEAYVKLKGIPRNSVFIGSIHNHHDFDYADLGGVRIISG
jgi:amino acid transporter